MYWRRIFAGLMMFMLVITSWYTMGSMIDMTVDLADELGVRLDVLSTIHQMQDVFRIAIVLMGAVFILYILLSPVKNEYEVRYV